jgi:hypothetical protein
MENLAPKPSPPSLCVDARHPDLRLDSMQHVLRFKGINRYFLVKDEMLWIKK